MTAYRIKDWKKHFENGRTRPVKTMLWVPISTKMGIEYTRLVSGKDGPSHFGVWIALVELGAGMPERGLFVSASGSPLAITEIATMIRMTPKLVKEAVERLLRDDIGWMQTVDIIGGVAKARSNHGDDVQEHGQINAIGHDITGHDTTVHPPTPRKRGAFNRSLNFDPFWEAYPKKKGKATALKAWVKIEPEIERDGSLVGRIMGALNSQKATDDWRKEGGKYIPHPASWLNGRRWEDEMGAPGGNSNGSKPPGPARIDWEARLRDHRALKEPPIAPEDERAVRAWLRPLCGKSWADKLAAESDGGNRFTFLASSEFLRNVVMKKIFDERVEGEKLTQIQILVAEKEGEEDGG